MEIHKLFFLCSWFIWFLHDNWIGHPQPQTMLLNYQHHVWDPNPKVQSLIKVGTSKLPHSFLFLCSGDYIDTISVDLSANDKTVWMHSKDREITCGGMYKFLLVSSIASGLSTFLWKIFIPHSQVVFLHFCGKILFLSPKQCFVGNFFCKGSQSLNFFWKGFQLTSNY